jgi:AcrR family transcriptional regulator
VSAAIEAEQLRPSQLKRRGRVIAAALELGAEGGYDAVQMRDVAARADVALGTIYRYFSSKDHVLAAAMQEWTDALRQRLTQLPPRGDAAADQLVDVFRRACRAMERQPQLTTALITALTSSDAGVAECTQQVGNQISSITDDILSALDPTVRERISRVIRHVWYATLTGWANGRYDMKQVADELENAIRLTVEPRYAANGKPTRTGSKLPK